MIESIIEFLTKTKIEDYLIISVGIASMYNSIMISEPYQNFIRLIDSESNSKLKEIMIQLITCPMCISFWTVLLLTLNPLMAGMSFVAAKIIDNMFYGR